MTARMAARISNPCSHDDRDQVKCKCFLFTGARQIHFWISNALSVQCYTVFTQGVSLFVMSAIFAESECNPTFWVIHSNSNRKKILQWEHLVTPVTIRDSVTFSFPVLVIRIVMNENLPNWAQMAKKFKTVQG